jgi:hypothetical protein
MDRQPFSWQTEMAIATAAVVIALAALYAVYLHKPA